jgi:hypothetical protein
MLMLEKIGMETDKEEEAKLALEHWQKIQGIDTENVEISPQMQAMMNNAWMYSDRDEEIPGNFMGSGRE